MASPYCRRDLTTETLFENGSRTACGPKIARGVRNVAAFPGGGAFLKNARLRGALGLKVNRTGQTGQCSGTVSYVLFALIMLAESSRFFRKIGQPVRKNAYKSSLAPPRKQEYPRHRVRCPALKAGKKGMRCGKTLPMPRLPPQL